MLLVTATFTKAQDIIVTTAGDALKVYHVEIGSETVFYQQTEASDAPTLRMARNNILMIKFQDGRQVIMDENVKAETASTQGSVTQSKPAETVASDVSDPEGNKELLTAFSKPVEYVGGEQGAKTKYVCATFKPTENSVFVDQNIVISCVANTFWEYEGKEGLSYNGYWKMTLFVKNRTNKTLYLDMGNCFVIRGTEAVPYYVPTITSSTKGNTRGGSVNLGGVTGALGIGGPIGTLANAINLGGGTSSSSTTTVFSQRIVAVPPTTTKELGTVDLMWLEKDMNPFPQIPLSYKRSKAAMELSLAPSLKTGEVRCFSPEQELMNVGFVVTYAEDEEQTCPHTLSVSYYLSQIIGLPNKMKGFGPKMMGIRAFLGTVDAGVIDQSITSNYRNIPFLLFRQAEK